MYATTDEWFADLKQRFAFLKSLVPSINDPVDQARVREAHSDYDWLDRYLIREKEYERQGSDQGRRDWLANKERELWDRTRKYLPWHAVTYECGVLGRTSDRCSKPLIGCTDLWSKRAVKRH